MIEYLPHVNATLNSIAAMLLISGFVSIKRSRSPRLEKDDRDRLEQIHKRFMIAAFLVSALFLACYVIYHVNAGSRKFPRDDYAAVFSVVYLSVLATHVILAAAVPFLAAITIYLGLAKKRSAHRKLARWTFPIWLYVSATGVLVYFMLYWWFLPTGVAEN